MAETANALVVGPTGATGSAVVAEFRRQGWQVHGISRTKPGGAPDFTHLAADLLDADSCRTALAGAPPVTHLVYAARAAHGEGGVEDVPANLTMLANVVDAAHAAGALRHVHLIEGTKWYGMHIGPYRTPAREDDPRHMPPNFYYEQQDFLASRQTGAGWHWSASRPGFICDFAPGRARNLVSVIAAYAAICRELGVPMDFPGTAAGYDTLTEVTEAACLAQAILWMSTTPAAEDQAFNITNGDVFRWRHLWPQLAEMCGVTCGVPRNLHLGRWMQDKGPVWERIVRRHDLRPLPLSSVADWHFADFAFRQEWDVMSDCGRIRRAGFNPCRDTAAMFCDFISSYRTAGIIPPSGAAVQGS